MDGWALLGPIHLSSGSQRVVTSFYNNHAETPHDKRGGGRVPPREVHLF